MRILVEDDVQLAEMLTEALSDYQHVVDVVWDGEAAWDWVESLQYDLIVLDLTLPKLDGVSFCQRLRECNSSLPVLMLTARDTVADKITDLDAGADDYVVKPFDMQECNGSDSSATPPGWCCCHNEFILGKLALEFEYL